MERMRLSAPLLVLLTATLVKAGDEIGIKLGALKQEAIKLDAELKAKLSGSARGALGGSPLGAQGGRALGTQGGSAPPPSPAAPYTQADLPSQWMLSPVNARPARGDDVIDWASIKELDNEVASLDVTTAFTPDTTSLQAGTSPLPDGTGKAYGSARVTYADSRFGTDYWAASRPIGLLLFNIGASTYACSATLVAKSLLVTAAHCVFDYGAKSLAGYYTNLRFYPQVSSGTAPYGFWPFKAVLIPGSYYLGTDTCTVRGIVCNNDIALVWLQPTGSTIANQAGAVLGWYPYAWNGQFSTFFSTPTDGFATIFGSKPTVAITQLGYPVAFDGGQTMQLSSSPGYQYATFSTTNGQQLLNLMRGTSLTGGSSGGPWTANYGVDAILSGTTSGSFSTRNAIVAVTSWGYTDTNIKVQGASWFGQNAEYPQVSYGVRGSGNIAKLMYDACDNPAVVAWQLESKGLCTS